MNKGKKRQTIKQTLKYKLAVVRERDGGMGKAGEGDQEDNYLDEHRVMHRLVESLYCTPETKITLYVNY